MRDLIKTQSADDLKEHGSIESIIDSIESSIHPLKITATSYEELFEIVSSLKINWLPFSENTFVSKRQEYIYYLLEHDGEKRNELLGVTDELYDDSKAAKRWYKKIAQIIRADLADDENATKAFQKLQEILNDLTDDEAFGDDNE